MAPAMKEPEVYWTRPTPHCPNSKLPVLVYRNVLALSTEPDMLEASVREAVERNNWFHGGTFKHYGNAHYHENTHECYAAIRGRTKCLYGVGPLDEGDEGVTFEMQAGDIAVHAAGVAHRNVESSDDYLYMGLYPKGSPKWNNSYCKDGEEETRRKAEESRSIPVPDFDPLYGRDGPLPTIWKQAIAA